MCSTKQMSMYLYNYSNTNARGHLKGTWSRTSDMPHRSRTGKITPPNFECPESESSSWETSQAWDDTDDREGISDQWKSLSTTKADISFPVMENREYKSGLVPSASWRASCYQMLVSNLTVLVQESSMQQSEGEENKPCETALLCRNSIRIVTVTGKSTCAYSCSI